MDKINNLHELEKYNDLLNRHCYNFILRKYNIGILDDFVDTTYIITITNSERIKNINEQLSKIIPTKNVYIVNNDGYKNCKKNLKEHKPFYDLTNSYFNIIEHSLLNNYNNILILEDDFIFSEKIKDKNIILSIKNFFDKNKNKPFVFNLGPVNTFFYPNFNIYNPIYKLYFSGTSHGIIYNRKIQKELINQFYLEKDIGHWDIFLINKYNNYFYKNPLCYQTYSATENKKYWFKKDFLASINEYIIFKGIDFLELDKKPEPGFTILYRFFFILNYTIWIVLFLIILILLYIIYYIFIKN